MSNPISVFIMDVSNSSKENIGKELSSYLQELKSNITTWTDSTIKTKVSHRAGDELVVISSGFASAYIIAFYISRIWNYVEHPPYFGLSFGGIEENIEDIDIETWIHPLMKQARLANDYIKQQQNRMQFRMELGNSQGLSGFEAYSQEFTSLINASFALQQEQMNEQTAIQSFVCSLYLILGQQNKVSEYLDRTKSTVSIHVKNGKTEVILDTFTSIVDVLNSLESKRLNHITDELQMNIKRYVNKSLDVYLPRERRI